MLEIGEVTKEADHFNSFSATDSKYLHTLYLYIKIGSTICCLIAINPSPAEPDIPYFCKQCRSEEAN